MFFSIIVRLIFGLIGLLLVVRLLGKEPMSEIIPSDPIHTLVLGGILEESTYDDNAHIGHVLFAIALQAVMIYGVKRIAQKNEKVNRWAEGELSVLIKDGVINVTGSADNRIEMGQLRTILRQQGCFSLENTKHVILENASQMSVLKKSDDDKALSILLVDEEQIRRKVLQSSRLDESRFLEDLKKEDYTDAKQLIHIGQSEEKGLYVLDKEDVMHESYRVDGQREVVKSAL